MINRPGEPLRSPLPLPVKKERQKDDFPLQAGAAEEFDIVEISEADIEAFDQKPIE